MIVLSKITWTLLFCIGLLMAPVAHSMTAPSSICIPAAATAYNVDPRLLEAIAEVESGMRPEAMNVGHLKRTGTYDIGWFQINSGWLPALKKFGINEETLKQPCVNANVGAWILRNLIDRHGPTWKAVGAYNAACTQLKGHACDAARLTYIGKVFRAYARRTGASAAIRTGSNNGGSRVPGRVGAPTFPTAPPQMTDIKASSDHDESDAIVSWDQQTTSR